MKRMRMGRSWLLLFIAALGIAGLGVWYFTRPPSSNLSPDAQAYLAAHDTLTFAVTHERSPLVTRLSNGELSGFLVEYVESMGIPLRTHVSVKLMTQEQALAALRDGTILGIADSIPSPLAFGEFDFSQNYLDETINIFFSSNRSAIRSLDELNNRQVAVLAGSDAQTLLSTRTNIQLVPMQSIGEALQFVDSGLGDAYVGSNLETLYFLETSPLRDHFRVAPTVVDHYPYAIGVKSGDLRAQEIVNYALNGMQTTGLGPRLQQNWFGATLATQTRFVIPNEIWAGMGAGLLFGMAILGLLIWHDRTLNVKVKERTRELAQSEEKYRLLIQDANDAILLVDPDTGFLLEVNNYAEKMFGYSRTELLRVGFRGLQWEAEFNRTLAALQAAVGSGQGTLDQVRFDVHEKTLYAELKVNRLTSAKSQGLAQCIARDITERIRMQEDLQRQNQNLSRLNQFTARLVPLQDPQATLRAVMDIFGELFRVDAGCLMRFGDGLPTTTFLSAEGQDGLQDQVRAFTARVMSTSLPSPTTQPLVIYRAETIDPETAQHFPLLTHYQILGIRFDQARQKQFLNLFSRRKVAFSSEEQLLINALVQNFLVAFEKAFLFEELENTVSLLKTQKRFSDSILDNVTNGILTIGMSGVLMSVNRAAEQILGYPGITLVGKPLRVLGPSFQDLSRDIQLILEESEMAINKEFTLQTRTGRSLPVIASISPLRKPEGAISGVILVLADMSQIKKLELERREMDRLATMGQMSAMMAHEIRNPLAGINAGIQYLNMRYAPDPSASESIRMVMRESERLNHLIDEILTLSREKNLNLTPTRLPVLMDMILTRWTEIARAQGVEIVRDYSYDLPEVRVDPSHLERGLENLVRNAFEAMQTEKNGKLWIAMCVETMANGQGPHSHFIIRVANSGKPIPPESVSRIFEPFFTTKARGTGLGLPIAKRAVEDHNGAITLESESPRSVMFTIRLPIDVPA